MLIAQLISDAVLWCWHLLCPILVKILQYASVALVIVPSCAQDRSDIVNVHDATTFIGSWEVFVTMSTIFAQFSIQGNASGIFLVKRECHGFSGSAMDGMW